MRSYQEIFSDIGQAIYKSDILSIEQLADEMEMLGSIEGRAAAANARAVVYNYTGLYQESLAQYRKALSLYEGLADPAGMSRVLGGLAIVFTDLGDDKSALDHYQRALEIHVDHNDQANVAVVTGNIGTVLSRNGDYPKALEHFRRAIDISISTDDLNGQAYYLGDLGTVYLNTGDFPQAMLYFQRALELHERLGNRNGAATVRGNMGRLFELTGDRTKALQQYVRSLAIHQELRDAANSTIMIATIGTLHLEDGDIPSALDRLREALHAFEQLGRRVDVQRTLGHLIKALLRSGQVDEAQQLLETQTDDSLDTPLVRAEHHDNRSILCEMNGEHQSAREHLSKALQIASEKGMRTSEATYHLRLRDLAQHLNDFPAYIHHNNEYTRITEEIRGTEVTQKLAVMDAERKMEVERRERDKERAVLYSTLPKHVADRVIRGEDVSGDHFDNAAVMFIDIVGFTAHTSHMPPADVVKMLENIFSTIDDICDRHSVTKVKTIGDSYMCFRGDSDARSNALCITHVALEVMKGAFTWPNGRPIQFRIGLHIGPATAGVIGAQRLQYDVWGDTVNVASRMESTSEPGRIHVSAAFATFLGLRPRNEDDAVPYEVRNDSSSPIDVEGGVVIPNEVRNEEPGTWHLALRGETEIKGKGTMTTYWLEGMQ